MTGTKKNQISGKMVYSPLLKQFQTFVSTHLLDVITLTETWLTDRIHDNEILRQATYCTIQIDSPVVSEP